MDILAWQLDWHHCIQKADFYYSLTIPVFFWHSMMLASWHLLAHHYGMAIVTTAVKHVYDCRKETQHY